MRVTEHPPAHNHTRRAQPATLAAAGILAAAWLLILRIHGPHFGAATCPSRALTGFDCPGCGSTRALAALTHGDIPQAASHNTLALLASATLLWAWIANLTNTTDPLKHPKAPAVLLVATITFTVLRNTPTFAWFASS